MLFHADQQPWRFWPSQLSRHLSGAFLPFGPPNPSSEDAPRSSPSHDGNILAGGAFRPSVVLPSVASTPSHPGRTESPPGPSAGSGRSLVITTKGRLTHPLTLTPMEKRKIRWLKEALVEIQASISGIDPLPLKAEQLIIQKLTESYKNGAEAERREQRSKPRDRAGEGA